MENHPGCLRCGLLRESYFSPDFKDPAENSRLSGCIVPTSLVGRPLAAVGRNAGRRGLGARRNLADSLTVGLPFLEFLALS